MSTEYEHAVVFFLSSLRCEVQLPVQLRVAGR